MSDLPDHPGPACPCKPCIEAHPERTQCPVVSFNIECALWKGHVGEHKSVNVLAMEWLYPDAEASR